MTTTNAAAVAAICTQLDGLPLAIELAAARTKLLTPAALLQALDRRLSLLVGGPRDVPARQQTLRGAIDWSYRLLTPAEQTLFARLAVFVGGCTCEAIEAVCNADSDLAIATLDGVAALLDNSLLRREHGPEGEPRLVMLDTIHAYARERFAASDEAAQVRERHAAYLLTLAERLEPALYGGPQTLVAYNKLDAELGNLRAALGWAAEHAAWEQELRIAAALDRFWFTRGYLSEGRRWLEAGLAQAPAVAPLLRARTLLAICGLARNQRDDAYTLATGHESLELFRRLGDTFHTVDALNRVAMAFAVQQDFGQAQTLYQEALELARANGFERFVGNSLNNLGCLALEQRDYGQAVAWLEECVTIQRRLGNRYGMAVALDDAGRDGVGMRRPATRGCVVPRESVSARSARR